MCMSPHEMTSARIEGDIEAYRLMVDDPKWSHLKTRVEYLIRELTAVLKERAENGTYDTAGHRPGDRSETQRTEYQDA